MSANSAPYSAVVFAVVIPWMEHSVPGVLNVAFLTLTAGLGMVMYLCCVYCEPGRVPAVGGCTSACVWNYKRILCKLNAFQSLL